MKKRLLAALGSLALAVSLLFGTVAPAHAVEANACHRDTGLDRGISVLEAPAQGGDYGVIFKGECTRQKYGWWDAQQFYVPSGTYAKIWQVTPQGTWYVSHTARGWGWHMVAGYSQATVFRASLHTA